MTKKVSFSKGDVVQVIVGCNGVRPLTSGELSDWYNSPRSKGMTDAGESKIPPPCTLTWIYPGENGVITKSRSKTRRDYGSETKNHAEVFFPRMKQTLHVPRTVLFKIES